MGKGKTKVVAFKKGTAVVNPKKAETKKNPAPFGTGLVGKVMDWVDSKASATDEYYDKRDQRVMPTSDGRPGAKETLSHVSNVIASAVSGALNPILGRKVPRGNETNAGSLRDGGGSKPDYYGTRNTPGPKPTYRRK